MTHAPCPPVKITPAVFQRCSIIGRAANENNGACGEETSQTKGERPLRRKYLQVYFIHIHHPFPSHQTPRWTSYLLTHTHVEIFKTLKNNTAPERFSWVFSGNPTWQSSKALCRHFGFGRGVPWVKPSKDASLYRPTTRGWVSGHSAVIPYYKRKAARLPCPLPNCDCQTLY